jgi:hypothetical protein
MFFLNMVYGTPKHVRQTNKTFIYALCTMRILLQYWSGMLYWHQSNNVYVLTLGYCQITGFGPLRVDQGNRVVGQSMDWLPD